MRRSLVILGALPMAVLLVYTGLWFHAARAVRQELPAWAEARRAEGYAIAWRTAEIDGFPFAFRLRLSDVTVEAARPVPATAASAELMLEASPWNLQHWRFVAPQGVRLSAPLAAVAIAAAVLDGTVEERDDGTVASLSARELTGSGAAAGLAADALEVRLTLPPRPPEDERDLFFALGAKLEDATLPQAPPPFAGHIDEISFAATMKGRVPEAPLDRALARWRDSGGTLDIDSARVVWGGTSVALAGTLALDDAMQPEGALTATIAGGDQMVDALVASGAIEERFAGFAKAVLRAIATPGENNGTAHVPVTVQDQRLYVGPATIAALPHVTWR